MSIKQTAVVTGANAGIGLAITQKLLTEGYTVIGTSRSGKIDSIQHPNLFVIQLDVTSQNSIDKAVKEIEKITSEIDLLINNAGVGADVFTDIPDRRLFQETLDTNVMGVVFFTEPLLTLLKKNSKVLVISSDMGLIINAQPNGPAYRMSKAAINMYTKMLSQRLNEQGITVTAVHPGWVKTRMGGSNAPLSPAEAANGIYNLIINEVESGQFWNAQSNKQVIW